jgi:uncharacterized protein (TIGR03382 family)
MFGENLMKRFYVLALTVALLFVLGSVSSFASPMTFDDIEYWVGTGQNRAALVIDWNDDITPECLVWGYRWDGTATGQDMFQAVIGDVETFYNTGSLKETTYGADARLSAKTTYYDGYGLLVEEIGYSDTALSHFGKADWAGTGYWWMYVISTDGQAWGESGFGMTGRTLLNDDWDGYAFGKHPDGEESPYLPSGLTAASLDGQDTDDDVSTPVAEPGYLSLAALALAGLGRRRRR